MTDYISREVAVKIAEKYGLAEGSTLGHHSGIADCIALEISRVPAADVAPVRHGHWRRFADCGVTQCSVCDYSVEEYIEFRYCPNCGAKMDEEVNKTCSQET